jgi:hypothetical protein
VERSKIYFASLASLAVLDTVYVKIENNYPLSSYYEIEQDI